MFVHYNLKKQQNIKQNKSATDLLHFYFCNKLTQKNTANLGEFIKLAVMQYT